MPGGASLTGPTVIMRSDALTLTLSHREREPKPRRPGKAKPPPGKSSDRTPLHNKLRNHIHII